MPPFVRLGIVAALAAGALWGVLSIHWYPAEEVLTMWVWGSPQEAELYRNVAAEYRQQHPEIRLRLEVVPGRSIVQKLLDGHGRRARSRHLRIALAADAPSS